MVVCVNNVSLFKPINGVKSTNTCANNQVSKPLYFIQIKQDTFTPTQTQEIKIKQKFAQLFPNGEINKYFNEINKDFGITTNPELKFVYDEKSMLGGGYTFSKNIIEMNLYDLMSCDHKIVGIKDGKKLPLISPKEKLPLFTSKELGEEFIKNQNRNGKFGFDKLILEEVTPQEQKKFIIHKIVHECVHAKQHQDLRETEGIDDKDIIKAWIHANPKNLIEKQLLNISAENVYMKTQWKDKPIEKKYPQGSQMYQKSLVLLDAIKNYPKVDSPEYITNALEKEAFDESAKYINMKHFNI